MDAPRSASNETTTANSGDVKHVHLLCLEAVPETDKCLIAICMGKNPMNVQENVEQMLAFVTQRHARVVILVCDEIHKWEQSIGSKMSSARAYRLAMAAGDAAIKIVQSAVASCFADNTNIEIVRWKDIIDPQYEQTLAVLRQHQPSFQAELDKSSAFYIRRRLPGIQPSQQKLDKFTEYTMNELPVQLYGARIRSEEFKLIYHPVYVKDTMTAETYVSPITDITKTLRSRSDVMQDLSINDASADAQVARLYFPLVV